MHSIAIHKRRKSLLSNNQKKQSEAIEKIEEYIMSNELKADDKILSERSMQKMWGFNRTTLRSAIRYLTLTGTLYSKRGSGTFVAPKKLVKNLQDARGTYQFALESGKKLTNKVLTAKRMEANKQIVKNMKVPLGTPIYKISRLRYLDGIPVTYSTVYLNALMFEGLENFDFSKGSLYELLKNNYGLMISGGEELLNITYSDEYESSLLEIPYNSPLIYQSGVTSNAKGEIFEYFKELTRSEYILFASELKRVNKEEL